MNAAELELVERVRELARGGLAERAAATDRDRAFPAKNVDELRTLGVTAMLLPERFGGLGMGVMGFGYFVAVTSLNRPLPGKPWAWAAFWMSINGSPVPLGEPPLLIVSTSVSS